MSRFELPPDLSPEEERAAIAALERALAAGTQRPSPWALAGRGGGAAARDAAGAPPGERLDVQGPRPVRPPGHIAAGRPRRREMNGESTSRTGSRWISVARLLREDEARLLAGRLQAEGIDARTDPEEIGTYYGPAVEALMRQGIDVLVPEDRVFEARALIEELERP